MTFTYTGIRVRDLDKLIAFYTPVLGMSVEFRMRIRSTHGEVTLLRSPRGKQWLDLNWYEPGTKFAAPYRTGDELDHLAFRTPNLSRTLRQFRKPGYRL